MPTVFLGQEVAGVQYWGLMTVTAQGAAPSLGRGFIS